MGAGLTWRQTARGRAAQDQDVAAIAAWIESMPPHEFCAYVGLVGAKSPTLARTASDVAIFNLLCLADVGLYEVVDRIRERDALEGSAG